MIGNDIIDLKAAKKESNWQRRGFLQKLFTEAEQYYIFHSETPFLSVWLFWSMKEAAYKCYVRSYQKRFFAPKKFLCSMVSATRGRVYIENNIYHTTTTITDDYIHTIASIKNNINSDHELFFTDNYSLHYQKKYIHQHLIRCFSKITQTESQQLNLFKTKAGVPTLLCKEKKTEYSFSISHHGNYGGFAILK